jgi:hypothetical protein
MEDAPSAGRSSKISFAIFQAITQRRGKNTNSSQLKKSVGKCYH